MSVFTADNFDAYPAVTDMWDVSLPADGFWTPSADPVPSGWSYSAEHNPKVDIGTVAQGRDGRYKPLVLPFCVHTITDSSTSFKVNSGKGMWRLAYSIGSTRAFQCGHFKITNFNSAPVVFLAVGRQTSATTNYRAVYFLVLNANGSLSVYANSIAGGEPLNRFITTGYTYDSNKPLLNYFDDPGGALLIGTTPAGTITANTWYFIEIGLTAIDSETSLSELEVRLNGTTVLGGSGAPLYVNRYSDSDVGSAWLCHMPLATDYGNGQGVRTTGVSAPSGVVSEIMWDSVFAHRGVISNDGWAGPSTVYSLKTASTVANSGWSLLGSGLLHAALHDHKPVSPFLSAQPGFREAEFQHETYPADAVDGKVWSIGTRLMCAFATDDVQVIRSRIDAVVNGVFTGTVTMLNGQNTARYYEKWNWAQTPSNSAEWTTELISGITTHLLYEA